MCYFGKGALWHEKGAGLHVKADPVQPVCDLVDSALVHATAVTQPRCSNIQMSSLGNTYCEYRRSGSAHVGEVKGSVIGFNSEVSHVGNTLKEHIKCANDSGDKTLTVCVIADIMCNDISVVDRGCRG